MVEEVIAKKVILRDVNTGGFLLPMVDTSAIDKRIEEVKNEVDELENKVESLQTITFEEY